MIIKAILFSIEAICSVLLITIILMQKAKGGLGLAFGGGMGEQMFGARAGNVLTRATIVLSIAFMVNTMILAIVNARSHESTLMGSRRATAPAPMAAPQQQQQMPPLQQPAPAAAPATQPAMPESPGVVFEDVQFESEPVESVPFTTPTDENP